jgi:hypothetical protein
VYVQVVQHHHWQHHLNVATSPSHDKLDDDVHVTTTHLLAFTATAIKTTAADNDRPTTHNKAMTTANANRNNEGMTWS